MPQFILCDCCGKSVEDFESRLEYFKHLQIAEKCKNCDKDFLSKHDLNAHTILTLRALHDVKEACFKPILKPNWRETITRFKNDWCDIFMDFEIGFSNKVHIIIEHIPQVIERTGRSLHLSSEQVVEAAHAKFDKVWQRYKVNDLERDFHGEKLRNCVVDFNTKNL